MPDKPIFSLHGWKLILLIYLLLLCASHIWRAVYPTDPEPAAQQSELQVPMVKDTTVIADSEIRMAYRDIYRGSEKNPPVLLMLHGSPAGVSFFDPLIDDLAGDFRILAPDYPGYNGSERDLPDYSMRTFAVYIKHFMDSLDVGKVHLAGYSLGGGVAIYMSEYYPERVHSLVLISSLGVQELELLGSYRLNHMVHGAQLGLIWMLHEAVPHFGLLDDVLLNVPYARSFYDSDQRPLRGYLEEFRGPMLIQHGTEDGLVPVAAAKEHHRLVPQSRLQLYDGGHLILRSKSNMLAADIETFIRDVEAGEARTFAEADPRRKALARKPFRQVTFVEAEGITLFVIMIIIAFSTLISEDLTCITAGMLAARGLIGIWPAIIACFAGILIGDIGLYLAGRFLGRPAVSKVPFRWFISEEDLERSSKWFNAKGPAIILMSRFVPGTRLPTYFSAGVIGAGFWMFTFYFTLAAALWTPILVGLSMLVGSELLRYFEIYREYAFLVVILAIFVLYFSFKFVFPLVTWKGRRMVLSRWRRLTRWEFWPPYVIYIPVCLYIIVLWWRHSKLTVFTAANPGIEDGGFIGESKSEILQLFSQQWIPPYRCLSGAQEAGVRIQQAAVFMEEKQLDFPVVLKPDSGQRGEGVEVIKSRDMLEKHIKQTDYDLILQQYIGGKEYGVFYYRYPGSDTGRIFSITDKRYLTLTGDGSHTLEELILKDDRAVCMAGLHFEKHRDRLYEVPNKGEEIPLVEVGTHARGALFLDGSQLITENLRSSIDRIAGEAEGFFFGRLDVKVPDEQSLKEGKGLSVIEVNGVTSEATSIYDLDNSFIDAQRTLREQWRIAYEIGEENFRRHKTVSPASTLLRKLIHYDWKG